MVEMRVEFSEYDLWTYNIKKYEMTNNKNRFEEIDFSLFGKYNEIQFTFIKIDANGNSAIWCISICLVWLTNEYHSIFHI